MKKIIAAQEIFLGVVLGLLTASAMMSVRPAHANGSCVHEPTRVAQCDGVLKADLEIASTQLD